MALDVAWYALVVLGLLALLANAASLAQGARLRGRVRRALRMAFGAYVPPAAVLLPVRGLDEGFDANLRAILDQAYPRFRLVVIADDPGDPALDAIRRIAAEAPAIRVETTLAGDSEVPGKANALRAGLASLQPDDGVVVFADADIRPGRDWLRQLVQPLADITVGVSTGFRWYMPPRPTFWSLVRAEWNAVSANVLFDPALAYAWGGSCAVRAEHLPALRLEERWRTVLSDDLVLTSAVREAGLRIVYAPAALVPTFEGADRRTCVEWCLRQMTMAVLYRPRLRRYAATAFAVFDGAVLLGLASLFLAAVEPRFLVPAGLLLATLPATVAKASLRRRAFLAASPAARGARPASPIASALAALVVPWLMAWGLLRTRRPTVVRWRGRTYDVRDPMRVRLLSTEPTATGARSPGTSRAR